MTIELNRVVIGDCRASLCALPAGTLPLIAKRTAQIGMSFT